MRSSNRNFRDDGKVAMSKRLAQIKLEKHCRFNDKKYDKLIKKLTFQKQKIFKVDGIKYRVHPIYVLYASSRCGKIININRKRSIFGSGYLLQSVRKSDDVTQTTYHYQRFIWECYNCLIPSGFVVDHINNKKTDNRLKNLQLETQQQNAQKYHN